ncbi:MAG: hypothetical protein LGL72_18585, partial [Acidibrevibacterium sp.]
ARAALLERWKADTEASRGKRFVFAYTNEEVRRLNDAIQAIEIERGRVRDCITLETERGTLSVGVGDRIAFRGTWKPKGIHAGALATVASIEGTRMTVRSDRGREIVFDNREFTNIDLGYAGTIYRGQGKILDQTYLLREGLEDYEAHGLIHWQEDLEEARATLLERWSADTETSRGKRFVFAYTNEEVRRLNDALQAIEITRGRVRDCITLETERGTLSVGVGDRIAFRGTWKPKGIYAGALATVASIEGTRMTVRSDRGREIVFDNREFTNIDLGYAGTIYRGQGKTLDQTYLLHT